MKYKAADHIASRVIKGHALLLASDSDHIYQLNETGTYLWSLILDEMKTISELADALFAEFDVEYQTAMTDVQIFIETLSSQGFLTQSA